MTKQELINEAKEDLKISVGLDKVQIESVEIYLNRIAQKTIEAVRVETPKRRGDDYVEMMEEVIDVQSYNDGFDKAVSEQDNKINNFNKKL